jgi:hypothetical protein
LISTFSRRLTQVALNGFRGGVQYLQVRLGDNRVDDRRDDESAGGAKRRFLRGRPAGRVTEMVRDQRLGQ